MKSKFFIEKSHLVYCPKCFRALWSIAGTHRSMTITCRCGTEVLRY